MTSGAARHLLLRRYGDAHVHCRRDLAHLAEETERSLDFGRDGPEDAMTRAHLDLVTPEVVQKIRLENRLLLERTQSVQASIETGRFDEAAPIAAELDRALRKQVLLIDGVLDVLSPDDVLPAGRQR
jgi:hypothetical protein